MYDTMKLEICSLLYIIILQCIYFVKRKYNFVESKIYKVLLLLTTFLLVSDISAIYFSYKYGIDNIIPPIFIRIYFISLIIWSMLYLAYILVNKLKDKNNYDSIISLIKNKKILTSIYILTLITLIIVSLFIPFNYSLSPFVIEGDMLLYIYIIATITTMILLLSLVINSKHITIEKNFMVLISILLYFASFILQATIPSTPIISSAFCLVTIFIYFTFENPDLKYIDELNDLRNKAESANNAKTDFLASVSHEIRTPLNAIIGLSESIPTDELPASIAEDIKNINGAGNILLEIVNNILDITKVEEGKMTLNNSPYSLADIISELTSLVNVTISEKPIKFIVESKGNIPSKLIGDEVKVHQVLLNILSNACKYTKKGTITLSIDSRINGNKCNLTFKVIDTGIGIKKSDYDKIFQKFERLDQGQKNIEGTGLGLVITKELLNLMGGKISFESVYQQGTTFTINFEQEIADRTLITNIAALEPKKNILDEHFDGSQYNILLVDDNLLNLKVAEKILKSYNFKITVAKSGLECLNLTKNNKYDLIFLDHMMPEMDGIQTLYNLKNRASGFDTPVVVLTANAIEGSKEKYLKEGFKDYLSKPISQKELDRILREQLHIE